MKALQKRWMMLFILSWKLYLFLRYLHFCPYFFGYVGERQDKKAKVNFKIYDFTNWNINNFNKHIAK